MIFLFIIEFIIFILMINCVITMGQNLQAPKKVLEEQKFFRIFVSYLILAIVYMLFLLAACVGTVLNILEIYSEKKVLPASKLRAFLLDTILFAIGLVIIPAFICIVMSVKFKDTTMAFSRIDLKTIVFAGGVLAYHVIYVAINNYSFDDSNITISKSYKIPESKVDKDLNDKANKKAETSVFSQIMKERNNSAGISNQNNVVTPTVKKKDLFCEKCGKKIDSGKEYVISIIDDDEEITQTICENCLYELKKSKREYSVVQSPSK